MFGDFSNDELTSIVNAVQYARAQLGKQKIRQFVKGDTVKFTSTKRGVTVVGIVTKVAIKYVTVKEGIMLWKVPANMLEAA
jgi:dsDNA-specific endonuclease/ATPase MutS2